LALKDVSLAEDTYEAAISPDPSSISMNYLHTINLSSVQPETTIFLFTVAKAPVLECLLFDSISEADEIADTGECPIGNSLATFFATPISSLWRLSVFDLSEDHDTGLGHPHVIAILRGAPGLTDLELQMMEGIDETLREMTAGGLCPKLQSITIATSWDWDGISYLQDLVDARLRDDSQAIPVQRIRFHCCDQLEEEDYDWFRARVSNVEILT